HASRGPGGVAVQNYAAGALPVAAGVGDGLVHREQNCAAIGMDRPCVVDVHWQGGRTTPRRLPKCCPGLIGEGRVICEPLLIVLDVEDRAVLTGPVDTGVLCESVH